MFAKTVCKPGAFMTVVPNGLLTTLHYNAKGTLDRITFGYEENNPVSLDSKLSDAIKQSGVVPRAIKVLGGRTEVLGVIHTDELSFCSGKLPDCDREALCSKFIEKKGQGFKFYGGHVSSTAVAFNGIQSIRNWLDMFKFNQLPGYIVPAGVTPQATEKLVLSRYPFKYPLVSGFMFHEMGQFRYISAGVNQAVIKSVSRFNDMYGHVKAKLTLVDAEPLEVHYSEVIKWNLNAKTAIWYLDNNSKLLGAEPTDNKVRDKRISRLTCEVCGKQFNATLSGTVTCDDPHCPSHLYTQIQKFTKVLDLPTMGYEVFEDVIKNKQMLCLTDLLLLPSYEDCRIKTTLAKLLEAVVPTITCPNAEIFTLFANRCGNSWKTMKYYIDNPLKLVNDLNIQTPFTARLMSWLSDGYNVTTLETLISSEQIEIVTSTKKFDGAPIFRGKKIAITGKFLHGDVGEIISILESYSAKVVTQFDTTVNCVIVGHLKQDVDGQMIQSARASHVPVFEERQFFAQYEIDADLKSNLL